MRTVRKPGGGVMRANGLRKGFGVSKRRGRKRPTSAEQRFRSAVLVKADELSDLVVEKALAGERWAVELAFSYAFGEPPRAGSGQAFAALLEDLHAAVAHRP